MEEDDEQNLSFLGMISKSIEDSPLKRNLRKRKPVSYFQERRFQKNNLPFHPHEKRKAVNVEIKSPWKKSDSENKVP